MKLCTLLVVIDPEHEQQLALQRAAEVARKTGAVLHLLQVDYHPGLEAGLLDHRLLSQAREAMLLQSHEALSASVDPLREEGLAISLEVRWAKRAHQEILDRVAVLQPDVLFKTFHPAGALRRLLLSDTSWQLIRRSPVPLWLANDRNWNGRRLCAALDPLHSADKPAALDHQLIRTSQGLQALLGLQADYLHAHAPLPRSLMFDAEMAREYEDYQLSSSQQHRQAFECLLAEHSIDVNRTHLLEGFAEEVIPHFVREQDVDLLVMGAIARGHLESLLLGHTAERVLERVECDLLVIKPDDKE
ncbi:universal stress protein [Pseudomonas sp. NCCP-436]|uniref:universal stress protein n=1 Tax=Pseudomonas sp. NCCP-436 TaxID=2842481 RepID=UPI001C7EDDDB|nr:universal stress protein [Pseudomonas sp. NCCP-436]GIZ11044.1 hypothetical protein NCCP436_04600 [Pseudomonas sp. NCCP-436]